MARYLRIVWEFDSIKTLAVAKRIHPLHAKTAPAPERAKRRGQPKGRTPDPQALGEVRALLGTEPRRRDLLIEHLHRIQDHYDCLSAAHLVAHLKQIMGHIA